MLLFPGVGAFGACLQGVTDMGVADALRQYIAADRPFFGICIGLQALCAGSDESPDVPGLAVFPGARVGRFSGRGADDGEHAVSVPHMGWNGISVDSNRLLLDTGAVADGSRGGAAIVSAKEGAVPSRSRFFTAQLAAASFYFVHSYCIAWNQPMVTADNNDTASGGVPSPTCSAAASLSSSWALAQGQHGADKFVAVVERGACLATQFHPEKSGPAGLRLMHRWLAVSLGPGRRAPLPVDERVPALLVPAAVQSAGLQLARRVVAALDVRTNDQGDLVVTKGAQYDVREQTDQDEPESAGGAAKRARRGAVRNLGKPVELAEYYWQQGADEICFLNITSFKNSPLKDFPMLEVLRAASRTVFVPLTVGGGIRDLTDGQGQTHSALDVAAEYFRSGADKVSLGSDAVRAADQWIAAYHAAAGLPDEASVSVERPDTPFQHPEWRRAARAATQNTSISCIARAYGRQAVVISADPRRVYAPASALTCAQATEACAGHQCVRASVNGPDGEQFCWYQCTVRGGRETRDLDVVQLSVACEAMGAGEMMLNCIDRDGTSTGFEHSLMDQVRRAVSIPIVASSGAGNPGHFVDVFQQCTRVEAALAAGMFHRREVSIKEVKTAMIQAGISTRQ